MNCPVCNIEMENNPDPGFTVNYLCIGKNPWGHCFTQIEQLWNLTLRNYSGYKRIRIGKTSKRYFISFADHNDDDSNKTFTIPNITPEESFSFILKALKLQAFM